MVYVVRLNLKGFFIKYRLYCTLCKDFDWWMAKVLNRTQFVVLSACIIHVLHHALYVWHPFGNKPGFPILPVGVTRFNWHRFLPQQYFATTQCSHCILLSCLPLSFPLLRSSQFENLCLHFKCQQCGNLVLSFTCALCLCFPLFDVSLSRLISPTWNAIQWALSNCCSCCCCCWQIRTFFIRQSGAACTIRISVLEMSACHEAIMLEYAKDI